MKVKLTNKIICKRCGKIWLPRKSEIRMCPKCKSPWFDTSKIKKNIEEKKNEKIS